MSKLVSVIIPFYNEDRYLKGCLNSLLQQSYQSLEIITIDDGSTDSSEMIVKSFPMVRLFNQKHGGPGKARNLGVSKAKGEILVFADADMEYHPDYVKILVEPIIEGKAFGTSHIDERVANPENMWSRCWSINAGHQEGKRTPWNISGKLNIFRALKREDFNRVGGFDYQDGYFDDRSLSEKLDEKSEIVKGAIAYHHNPATLSEVYYSARWIGKSPQIQRTWQNIARYTLPNSLRNAVKKIALGAPLSYLIFKVVYDTGMLCGILTQKTHAK